jgi:hypothetical protein
LGQPLATFKCNPIGVFIKNEGYKDIAKSNEAKENEENKMED